MQPQKVKIDMDMSITDVHFFDKQEGTRIVSFTLCVNRTDGTVIRSGYADRTRFKGDNIQSVISTLDKEGFKHTKI